MAYVLVIGIPFDAAQGPVHHVALFGMNGLRKICRLRV